MEDATNEPLVGASVWARDLYSHLTEHARNEREVLEQYVAAADATDSKAFSFVVKLLIEDERRHHILFQEFATSLKHDAEFLAGDPAIPRLDLHLVDGEVVRDLTEQLVAREKADLRELKKLKKDLRDFKDTTLWSLLVDLMLRDTEKHIALLGFVEKHT